LRQPRCASQKASTLVAVTPIWYLVSAPSPRASPSASHQRIRSLCIAFQVSAAQAVDTSISTVLWL
jgi:hypothetical protein